MNGENDITCRITVDGAEVFVSRKRGIAPLLGLIDVGTNVAGGVAYDRIVGKAAALLYALMGVKQVHAGVMSAPAAETLSRFGIAYTFETLAERIINRTGDGSCPMEKTVENIDDPQAALAALKQKLAELSSARSPTDRR